MSRTYRRKNYPLAYWGIEMLLPISEWGKPFDSNNKQHLKARARFHSDRRDGYFSSPPRPFVKEIEKQKDMQDRQELIRFLKYRDNDYEPVFNPRKRDAGWHWW